jgi:hypothetical protein
MEQQSPGHDAVNGDKYAGRSVLSHQRTSTISPARRLLGRSVYGSNTDLPVSGAVEKMLPP